MHKHFLIILFLSIITIKADDGISQHPITILTLEQAIVNAGQQHPDIQVLKAEIEVAKGSSTTAAAAPNPDINIGPGLKSISEGGSRTTLFSGELGISQMIEFPGKRSLRKSIAEKNITLKKTALEGFLIQLQIEVKRCYFQTQLALQMSTLKKEQVVSAQTFLQSAQKRVQNGYASDFEMMKAQTELISAQKDLQDANKEYIHNRLKLAGLVGIPLDTNFRVDTTFQKPTFLAYTSDPILLALSQNSSIKAQKLLVELSTNAIQEASLNRKPDLTVNPAVEYTKGEQVYGINFSMPLPIWNNGKGVIQVAKSEHQKSLAELKKLQQEITMAINSAQNNLAITETQLALYTKEYLESIQSILQRTETVYYQNTTNLLLYLEARQSYYESMSDYYSTLGEWIENNLQLESAVGVVTAQEKNNYKGKNP